MTNITVILRCFSDHTYSISDVCLHVSETVREKKVNGLLPEYNCLMLSLANFWNQDRQA